MTGPAVNLRLSLTDRCSMRCVYCRPDGVPAPAPVRTPLGAEELSRFVRALDRSLGVTKVRITGGEPLLRPDVVEVVRRLKATGIPDLAMTTNGQPLAPLARELRVAGLDRLNISLDTLDPVAFTALSRTGSLARTLAGIEAALAAGYSSVKLNTVVMRGLNDHQIRALVDYALARGCEARFIELMPAGLDSARCRAWYVPSGELLGWLAQWFTLEPLPHQEGSSARRYRVGDREGRIGVLGLISPTSRPFCAGCRRLRLTAGGDLVACLGRDERIPLGGLLRAGDETSLRRVSQAAREALQRKRTGTPLRVPVLMSATGG